MKTIGLLGGMSWESTASYYQALNEGIKTALGGLHSAKIVLNSVDFHEIEQLQHQGNWPETAQILGRAATSVEKAGADFLLICTNTMHKVASDIQAQINIPILHIADATAQKLLNDNVQRVGLLGTKFTMTEAFYKNRLVEHFGIDVVVPTDEQQDLVHRVIYQELCLGEVNAESKKQYLEIIDDLQNKGAQAVILGCTEIALLVKQSDTEVPLYDTTAIHAQAAINEALKQSS